MKIFTESGSIYEIESQTEGYRVRRLINGAPALDNVRATEQWRMALRVSEPIVGEPMLIAWRWNGAVLETTQTSPILHITDGEPN